MYSRWEASRHTAGILYPQDVLLLGSFSVHSEGNVACWKGPLSSDGNVACWQRSLLELMAGPSPTPPATCTPVWKLLRPLRGPRTLRGPPPVGSYSACSERPVASKCPSVGKLLQTLRGPWTLNIYFRFGAALHTSRAPYRPSALPF